MAILTWADTLEAVRRSGERPLVVFPSSAAVYGNPATLPVPETALVDPISPYGFHKAACEILAREYATCFGLSLLVCRLFSVFGFGQRRLLVWELFRQFDGPGTTVRLQGTGRESRDYLHTDDIGDALLHLCARPVVAGECALVNLASGLRTETLDLALRMKSLLGSTKDVVCRGESRRGHPDQWQADIGRLRALAPAWHPRDLSSSLQRCLNQWKVAGGENLS